MNIHPVLADWFEKKGWKPFVFQRELWSAWDAGKSGLLNAPTGSGKTYAVWIPAMNDWMNQHPEDWHKKEPKGIQVLWLTPLRALAKDTEQALTKITTETSLNWSVRRLTGDTSQSIKQKIKTKPPACLITTPESLHILIARKNHESYFRNLKAVIVDEWHELLSSKRGVLAELGLARLRTLNPDLKIWGVSATIGNMRQALDVLTGDIPQEKKIMVVSEMEKETEISTIIPPKVESYSWAGHIGVRLIPQILPIIDKSQTTLLFTNTRAQAEIWYQQLLDADPNLAGQIALHHGSLDPDIRTWVEEAIHNERLKLVVSTSSLDLGVDFSPVETVIQIGSPKGVARFLQRAGRSGHKPGAISRIYFVPTHAMEIIESDALQLAIKRNYMEERLPCNKPLDVLVQYLCTRAVGDGFDIDQAWNEVRSAYAYKNLTREEFDWCISFITDGGSALKNYEEYNRVIPDENGTLVLRDRRKARRHRMSIGTITADPHLKVKFVSGGFIGTIEESFISKLSKGDTFLFTGRYLDFVRLKELTVYVKKSKKSKGVVSRWMGGRMQLSTQLSEMIRLKIEEANHGRFETTEMKSLEGLFRTQQERSALPKHNQLLIEQFKSREGWHLFFYPIEGRMVHEGMASLVAYRIAKVKPISFSMAMNDYGFELLSADKPPVEEAIEHGLFSTEYLAEDIHKSINAAEMGRRHFREIARISGLIFQGFPGRNVGAKHLQASAGLLFDVFQKYDEQNLLLKQTFDEIMANQLEVKRLTEVLERISNFKIVITHPNKPTPFAFPIMVDRLRAKLTSEKLEDRLKRLKLQLD